MKMRATLVIALSLLGFAACRGDRSPPLSAGAGVVVDPGAAHALAVDPALVPVLTSCADGQWVRRQGDHWTCGTEAELAADALGTSVQALRAEVDRLTERLGALESQAATMATAIQADQSAAVARAQQEAAWPYTVGAATCVPSQATVSSGRLDIVNGVVGLSDGSTGNLVLYCPVIVVRPHASWSSWAVSYEDGDGSSPGGRVQARLERLNAQGQLEVLASLDSNQQSSSQPGEMQGTLQVDWSPATDLYFVELSLERSVVTPVHVYGVRVGD
ncbi:MAG: hypothetical protein U1E65_27675 [Myxococcota bacterium]